MRPIAACVLGCALLATQGRAAEARPGAHPDTATDQTAPDTDDDSDQLADASEGGEVIAIEDRGVRAPASAGERVVDAAAIELSPRRSAEELLRLVPGLHTSQHGAEGKSPQIFWRGFDAVHGSDLELVVAGVPINEASHVHGSGYLDTGFVVPEVVRELRARGGALGLDQGPFATAGSVALELGVPAPRRGHRFSYEAGTTNRHRFLAISAPPELPEASFLAVEAMSDAGYGENRGTLRLSAMAQHQLGLGDGQWLRVLGSGYGALFGEPGTVPVAAIERGDLGFYDSLDPEGSGSSRRALAALHFRSDRAAQLVDLHAFAGWRHLRLRENYTGFLVHPERGDARLQRHRSRYGGLRGHYRRALTESLVVLAGASGSADDIDQADQRVTAAGEPWLSESEVTGQQLAAALYLGARAAPHPSLRLEAGGRLDAALLDARELGAMSSGRAGAIALSPRALASLRLTPSWRLDAGYGRGLRPPEARLVAAGAEARFARSHGVELGSHHAVGAALELGVTAFAVWLDSEVVFDHLSGAALARNPSRRLGLELAAELSPAPWLSLRADLSATDARFSDSGRPVPNAPRLLATAEARLRHPGGLRGGAQLRYLGPRPLAHGARGSAALLVDLLLAYPLGRFELGLAVDNALATEWREGEYHFASHWDPAAPATQIPELHVAAGRPFGLRASITTWF